MEETFCFESSYRNAGPIKRCGLNRDPKNTIDQILSHLSHLAIPGRRVGHSVNGFHSDFRPACFRVLPTSPSRSGFYHIPLIYHLMLGEKKEEKEKHKEGKGEEGEEEETGKRARKKGRGKEGRKRERRMGRRREGGKERMKRKEREYIVRKSFCENQNLSSQHLHYEGVLISALFISEQ